MNPHEYSELYDSILLAGVLSPGVVKLSGHKRSEKWDVKDGDGQDGASTTRKGKVPVAFTATFSLVVDPASGVDEFVEWEGFLEVLRTPVSGKNPKALDIYHPDLAELEITSVVVQDIGGKVHDGKGGATVTVTFLPYSPPKKKAAANPSGSKGSKGGKEDPNDPLVAALKELEGLLKEGDSSAPAKKSGAF